MKQDEITRQEHEAQLLRAPPTSDNKVVMWDEFVDLLRCDDLGEDRTLIDWYRDLKARILAGQIQVYVKPQTAKSWGAFLERLEKSADDDFDALSGCLFDTDRLAVHGKIFDTAHITSK